MVNLFSRRLHILCQLSVMFMDNFHDTGAVIVHTAVSQRAVAFCHIYHTEAVGETADA